MALEPGWLEPTQASPIPQPTDATQRGYTGRHDGPTLGELEERERNGTLTESDRALLAEAAASVRGMLPKFAAGLGMAIPESVSAKLAATVLPKNYLPDFGLAKNLIGNVPQGWRVAPIDWPDIGTVPMPPSPATADDLRSVEDRILDELEDLRAENRELRLRVARIDLRTERWEEGDPPPPDDSDSPPEPADGEPV